MRVLLTFIAIAFLNFVSFSQTFNGGGGNVPASTITPTCFNINVAGVGVINTTTLGLASVCLNINHGDVGDLEITLTAPDGTMVPLSIQNGGTGNNYTNTCFTATATNSIKFGTAPYTGNFLPEGWLGAVNNGQNANGTWRLCVRDRRAASSGSLVNWSLAFNNTPAPMPPPKPVCANTLPSNSSCSNATLVCDFNGQCGTTSGNSIQDWPGSGLDGDCFGLNNNSFIKFVASATTATFSVWIPTTSQTLQQGGVQMLFFSGTCNSGPVTVHGCYPRILPYPAGGQPLVSIVTATGLTPGNTYYLMIDGANGDNTTFTIAANTGVNVLNITPAAPSICEGTSVNLTATGGNGVYAWSPATYLNTTAGSTVTSTPPLGTQTYTVTSTTATGCPLTKDVTVTVTARPLQAATTVTPPNCITTTGSITVTSPLGAGFQYSNGGAFQSSPLFQGLTPGSSYSITVQNAAGCQSLPVSVQVPMQCSAPTPTVTTIAACGASTGTVTVTSPLGANYVYSLYLPGFPIIGPQASPIFTGVAAGTYMIIVQDLVSNCCANNTFTLSTSTPPAAPTGSVTAQPTCAPNVGGTITITAPLGAGLQYSINGGTTYQASPVFANLPQGTYTIIVQNAATCVSAASQTFTINAAPNAPATPTGSVTLQPSCAPGSSGTITITAPTGAGLQYSNNGGTTYQTSPVFANLPQGTYTITVQNAANCISAASLPFTINAAPTAPATPTGSVTAQPTCAPGSSGTITITAPTGAGLQYSINGGTTYQASPVFANLPQGTYTITVQNAANCVSAASLPFTINAAPTAPATPTGSVTAQPSCAPGSSGTITITAPTGAGLQYSNNGGTTYQASPVFSNLGPGTYTITVQNAANCVSAASLPFTINAAPNAPATPTGSVTAQPTCAAGSSGTITITAPTGAGLQYSNNGGTSYQTSPVFTNLPQGTYTITVQNAANCVSAASQPFTINAAPAAPATPVGSVTAQPTCAVNNGGTITITAPTGAGLQYSNNGGTSYQPSPVFANLVPGTYTITVQNAANCVSAASQPFTINGVPGAPAKPTLSVSQPVCTVTSGTITVTAPLGAGLEYNINGGTFQTNPVFGPLQQGPYVIKVRNAAGCESPVETAVINLPQAQPAKPVVIVVQPVCPALTGTITVSAPIANNIEYSRDGIAYQTSNVFLNVPAGSYNITARFTGTTCVSALTAATINRIDPAQCVVGTDIYFPSAFTPNGDMVNDGFGPGPRSSLASVTGYTLMVFNRYGEMVFKTTDPLKQWDGTYKGKMQANSSFTWVANYRFGTRAAQMKKGTVTMIR